jgi:hypothetical protein
MISLGGKLRQNRPVPFVSKHPFPQFQPLAQFSLLQSSYFQYCEFFITHHGRECFSFDWAVAKRIRPRDRRSHAANFERGDKIGRLSVGVQFVQGDAAPQFLGFHFIKQLSISNFLEYPL